MISHGNEIKVFTGNSNPVLAEEICAHLNKSLGNSTVTAFADGECSISVHEPVRGCDVFIVQSTCKPVNDSLMELLVMTDAMRRASAGRITAVVPYFGYARQDRKDKPRTSIGAKLMCNLLSAAGVSRVITMDLHADQIQGFFEVPVDHLFASNVFIPLVKNSGWENISIASPDTGGTKRASTYAKALNCELAIGYKQREKQNEVASLQIIGDVKDKNVILVDDIIDTAGTLCKAAARIKEMGAKSVRAMCAHGLFSGAALENIENSVLDEVLITDTIPLKRECPKVKVISVAPLLAEIIQSVEDNTSISSHYYV